MAEKRPSFETDSVFVIPIVGRFLLYAPLHNLAALTDLRAARWLQDAPCLSRTVGPGPFGEIAQTLESTAVVPPSPKQGDLAPAFLGLIPTRNCNLACQYCGFAVAKDAERVMDLNLVRDAIDWYMALVSRARISVAEIHFFGGEPFCAEEVMDFAFHCARLRAADAGCTVRFEVATNGTLSEERCRWAADSLDNIVLSLDGPADIQDRIRYRRDGRGSFEAVAKSAKILSEGTADLSFRVCITGEVEPVQAMPRFAAWLCQEFRPGSVSFEPVQPTAESCAAHLLPPDPWDFADGFCRAASILEAHGVKSVYASADIGSRRVSFCPVGQDVPIVSPDGSIDACYLLKRDRHAQGMDLSLGSIEGGRVVLDPVAVEAARNMNVLSKPLCAECFCRWHCAGGCHVNHVLPTQPGAYDRLCIQTRAIALCSILRAMGCQDLVSRLWSSRDALRRAVLQPSDGIRNVELDA